METERSESHVFEDIEDKEDYREAAVYCGASESPMHAIT